MIPDRAGVRIHAEHPNRVTVREPAPNLVM
jgi:hypothetical protein